MHFLQRDKMKGPRWPYTAVYLLRAGTFFFVFLFFVVVVVFSFFWGGGCFEKVCKFSQQLCSYEILRSTIFSSKFQAHEILARLRESGTNPEPKPAPRSQSVVEER